MQSHIMERKRVIKTTRMQYEIYVRFLEDNKPFARGKMNFAANENYFAEKWNELINLLNTSGSGPTRTLHSWKTLLSGWKNQTRSKARKVQANNLSQNATGNLFLSAIEQRALRAWSGNDKNYLDSCYTPRVSNVEIKKDISSSNNSLDGNEPFEAASSPPHNTLQEPAVILTMPMEYEGPEEKISVDELDYVNEDINNMTATLINATNTNTKILKEVHMATSSALEAVAASVNKVGEALLALAHTQQLAHTNEKLRLEFALAKIKLEIAQLNKHH